MPRQHRGTQLRLIAGLVWFDIAEGLGVFVMLMGWRGMCGGEEILSFPWTGSQATCFSEPLSREVPANIFY